MSKKSKNCNFKDTTYENNPFNRILSIYVENTANNKKKDHATIKGERLDYKQQIYEELSALTGIPSTTIKNYAIGKSAPPVNTKLNEYKKFAEIFGCSFDLLLPEQYNETKNKEKLLHSMGFDESTYNKLLYKSGINLLFPIDKPINEIYFKILNSIINDSEFMDVYEGELCNNLSELIHNKNSSKDTKNMTYLEYREFLTKFNVYTLDELQDNIIRAFKLQLEKLIISMFDEEKE